MEILPQYVQLGRLVDAMPGERMRRRTKGTKMQTEDAYDFLIEYLQDARLQTANVNRATLHERNHCDLWLPVAALEYARRRGDKPASENAYEKYFQPLHDAGWDLCRIGV